MVLAVSIPLPLDVCLSYVSAGWLASCAYVQAEVLQTIYLNERMCKNSGRLRSIKVKVTSTAASLQELVLRYR